MYWLLKHCNTYINTLSHLFLLVLSIATDLQGYTGTYIAAIIRQVQDVKVLGSITCKILSVSLVCLIPGPFNFRVACHFQPVGKMSVTKIHRKMNLYYHLKVSAYDEEQEQPRRFHCIQYKMIHFWHLRKQLTNVMTQYVHCVTDPMCRWYNVSLLYF